jgi:hypothetical protein
MQEVLVHASWKEVAATGKGDVRENKSEGSHQQKRGNDAWKSDRQRHLVQI